MENRGLREILAARFEEEGYFVALAPSGSVGIQVMRGVEVDLILIDGDDRSTLLHDLHSRFEGGEPCPPVICIGGSSEFPIASPPVVLVLDLPFDDENLMALVKKHAGIAVHKALPRPN